MYSTRLLAQHPLFRTLRYPFDSRLTFVEHCANGAMVAPQLAQGKFKPFPVSRIARAHFLALPEPIRHRRFLRSPSFISAYFYAV